VIGGTANSNFYSSFEYKIISLIEGLMISILIFIEGLGTSFGSGIVRIF
jgi:hypothetical protein